MFTYDPNGRLLTETDPENGTVTFGYDLAGQRTTLTDPNSATRSFGYDDGGRLTGSTDAEGRTTTFAYDAVGRQTNTTDARGITINNSFDDAGQLTSQVSPSENRTFSYDDAGRNVGYTDASGSTTVTYDDAGRMTGITNPAGTVSYGYNNAGEQTSMTQPEGTVTTSYDVNGFMDTVTDWRGDTITMVNDPDGRMLTAERSNNVDTAYGYDTAGRLNNIEHANGATIIDEYAYSLDGNGNRTAVTSTAGTESYTLDGLNRVTDVSYPGGVSEAFTYDPAGNRVEHTNTDGDTIGYTVDATGQLLSDTTGTTYSYDQAGNLLATSAGDAYVYDDYGRTVEASGNGITQTFGYDATDVRVTVDSISQLWDRNGGLPTLISTGVGDNYVHTNAGIARDGDDWLLADAVGSVRAIVDDTGATTGSQDFTVFGEQLTGTGDFGFAGEQADLTGQLHLRTRQYNPTLGRFTSVDPVQPGAPGTTGYNLYAYSGNNPTTWTDPSGRAVLGEYATLVGDQADATEVFASSVGNCTNAAINQATAGLQGADLGPNPTRAIATECRNGVADASAGAGVFFVGGRLVDNAADIVSLNRRAKALSSARSTGVPRFDGPKPLYEINPAHVPGAGLRRANPKTPLPDDAESVFRNAIPDDPVNPSNWFGVNADGQIYRFAADNGRAHFNGIAGVGDGLRNVSDYAIIRLVALVG